MPLLFAQKVLPCSRARRAWVMPAVLGLLRPGVALAAAVVLPGVWVTLVALALPRPAVVSAAGVVLPGAWVTLAVLALLRPAVVAMAGPGEN